MDFWFQVSIGAFGATLLPFDENNKKYFRFLSLCIIPDNLIRIDLKDFEKSSVQKIDE